MEKVNLARRRNLLGEPQENLITSGDEPDKLFPYRGTNPFILFIMLLDFSNLFSVDTFIIFIYYRLFIQNVVHQSDTYL